MVKELTIRNRTIVITLEDAPRDAKLTIDGVEIPLTYRAEFKGWGVAHTLYGYFTDLERLAEHMIVSNPKLVIGHGLGGHHHE